MLLGMDEDEVLVRHLDVAGIKALAHPLRLRMLHLLRAEGPATATELAQRIGGTTSGTTSWHLRQLAAAGLVVDAGEGGRDRRWRAAQRGTITPDALLDDPEGGPATRLLLREVLAMQARWLDGWLTAREGADREWYEAAAFDDALLRLTPDRLAVLGAALREVVERFREHEVTADDDTALPVSVVVHAFPRLDLDPGSGRWEG